LRHQRCRGDADVECSGRSTAPRRLDLVNDGLGARFVEIGSDDLHAFLGKPNGCGAADASRRRAGDDRDLALQSSHRDPAFTAVERKLGTGTRPASI